MALTELFRVCTKVSEGKKKLEWGGGDGKIQKRKRSQRMKTEVGHQFGRHFAVIYKRWRYFIPRDSAVPFLRIYPMEFVPQMPGNVNKKFIAACFVITENWKHLKCPSTSEGINCGIRWNTNEQEKWTTVMWNNMNEFLKRTAEQRKPGRRKYILYDSMHINFKVEKRELLYIF